MTGRINDWVQDDETQGVTEARESEDTLLRGWTNDHDDRVEMHLVENEDAYDTKYGLYARFLDDETAEAAVDALEEAGVEVVGQTGSEVVVHLGDKQSEFRGGAVNTATLQALSPDALGYAPEEAEEADDHEAPVEQDVRDALDLRVRDDDGELIWDKLQSVAAAVEGVPGSGIGAEEMYERIVEAKTEEIEAREAEQAAA